MLRMSSEQIRLQVSPKLFGVNSWIPQMIRQWIQDSWSSNRKCTSPKGAAANSRNWQLMTSDRSQMLATSNFRDWHTVVGEIPWSSITFCRPFHLSYDDCLEDKREDYQNCSVLYCVTQLCTVIQMDWGCWLKFGFAFWVAWNIGHLQNSTKPRCTMYSVLSTDCSIWRHQNDKHLGIASLFAVHLVMRVGRGWSCAQ